MQCLHETGRGTLTAHVNAGRPRTVLTPPNEDAILYVGSYLPLGRLTTKRYRNFLETVLLRLIEDVPPAVRWFQHDGAPAHYEKDA